MWLGKSPMPTCGCHKQGTTRSRNTPKTNAITRPEFFVIAIMAALSVPEPHCTTSSCNNFGRDYPIQLPMLLVFSAIFAFIWAAGVTQGVTFSGYIHIFLVASVLLVLAHWRLPMRPGMMAQPCPDPRQQRRLSRLLGWRSRPKKS